MATFYCANCGAALSITRKALPQIGIVVDLVNFHECTESPVPFDPQCPSPNAVPIAGKDAFLQSLNSVKYSKPAAVQMPEKTDAQSLLPLRQDPHKQFAREAFKGVGTDDLRDRRFDNEKDLKSTAPDSVADQIRLMANSIPSNELDGIPRGLQKDETDSVEMGD